MTAFNGQIRGNSQGLLWWWQIGSKPQTPSAAAGDSRRLPWTWFGIVPRQTLGLPTLPLPHQALIRVASSTAWWGSTTCRSAVESSYDPPQKQGLFPLGHCRCRQGLQLRLGRSHPATVVPPCIGNPGLPTTGSPAPSGPVPRPQPVQCFGGRCAAAPRMPVAMNSARTA